MDEENVIRLRRAVLARSGLTKAGIFVARLPNRCCSPCTLCWRSQAAEDKTMRTPECHRDPGRQGDGWDRTVR